MFSFRTRSIVSVVTTVALVTVAHFILIKKFITDKDSNLIYTRSVSVTVQNRINEGPLFKVVAL